MSIRELKNLKCFVTGAASGIGRATAIAAAAEGASLFLTDINDVALNEVVTEIRHTGGRVTMAQALDISDYDALRAYAETIHTTHGSMDVVMNVAGISVWGSVDALEHKHWRKVIEVNLMGPIHVIECFIPPMMAANRAGHLVNVSSAAGLFGLPWHAAYSASKFGLRGISEVLRFDLEPHNIGVSLVCPGGVRTGLVQTLEVVGVDMNSPRAERMRKRFERHAITPEHAARAILNGIKQNQYLVFTSNDIRIGHFAQRVFGPGYEYAMRRLNQQLRRMKP